MKLIPWVLALLAAEIFIASPSLAQGVNLGFETPSTERTAWPAGWVGGGKGFEVALDTAAYEGAHSVRMTQLQPGAYGIVTQSVSAASDTGQMVRLSGYLRTRGVTQGEADLWLRVADARGQTLSLNNMAGRGATGTRTWTYYEVEVPIPAGADQIVFGAVLQGNGTAWADALNLQYARQTAEDLPDTVETYVEYALDLMQNNSIRRDSIDWPTFRAATLADARGARTMADAYPALRHAVTRLGDGHSLFRAPITETPPQASAAETPTESATPTAALPFGTLVEDEVGYLWVPGFSHTDAVRERAFADTIQQLITNLDAQRACGWIVDLRGNGGGDMHPMLAGVGPVLGEGTAGFFVFPHGPRVPWGYHDGASWQGGELQVQTTEPQRSITHPEPPVAVLTGPGTASSGEAMVTAFRGRPGTRSFGGPTAGLSTANQAFTLPDGAMLVITVATLADRTGEIYGGVIAPDVNARPARVNAPSPGDPVSRAASAWLKTTVACTADLGESDQPGQRK